MNTGSEAEMQRNVANGKHDRRGSVLVLSLGVLVLMATLVLVFGGVAATDRRLGEGIESAREPDEVANQAAEFIAEIVGADALDREVRAVGVELAGGGVIARFGHMLESWDHPSSSQYAFSSPDDSGDAVIRNNPEAYRFRPSGGAGQLLFDLGLSVAAAAEGEALRPRRGSDPWLASDLPVDLYEGDTSGADFDTFEARRDYTQLSNFAPDGRAVNLFNLRNTFDQESGPAGMSNNLTLMPGDGNAPTTGGQTLPSGLPADINRPADWFSNQLDIAYPMSHLGLPWSDERRFEYQYADADGDGIADSRWIELVDRTDLSEPGRPLLDASGDRRYFFAVKAVDLSGRVNVNTATDLYRPPSDTARLGESPAEIDLLRLLSGTDAAADTNDEFYALLSQPTGGANVGNYIDFNDPEIRRLVGDTAYDYLRFIRASGAFVPGSVAEFHNDFQALEQWITENDVAYADRIPMGMFERGINNGNGADFKVEPDFRRNFWATARPSGFGGFQQPGSAATTGFYEQLGAFGNDSLLELLTRNGINDPAVLSPLEATVSGRVAIGGDDLRFSPLRSNRALTDELASDPWDLFATDIRRQLTTISGARPLSSGALRDPGATAAEPDRLPTWNIRLPFKAGATFADLQEAIEVWEYRVPLERLVEAYDNTDPAREQALAERNRLWRAASVVFDALVPLRGDGAELAWDADTFPELLTAFYGYRGPEFAYRTAGHLLVNWLETIEPDNAAFEDDIRGITLLLDNAGDFRTAFQSEPWSFFDSPSPVQWAMDPSTDLAVTPDDVLASVIGTQPIDPLLVPERGELDFRIGDADAGRPAQDPVVNLYAITPQPVIVEAASLIANADTPRAGGGDADHIPDPTLPLGPGTGEVTIDYQPHVDNDDFLFSLVGFQLHNPFTEDISLGQPGSTDSGFYIEYQGRFYPLFGKVIDTAANGTQLMSAPEVLAPGETITILIASQDLETIEDRLIRFDDALTASQSGSTTAPDVADADGVGVTFNSDPTRNGIEDLIREHFAPGEDLGNVMIVAPFDPTNALNENTVDWNETVQSGFFNDDLDGGRLSGDIFLNGFSGDDEVRLWRVNPNDATMRDDVLVDRLRTLQLASGTTFTGRIDRAALDRATRNLGNRLPGGSGGTNNPNNGQPSVLRGSVAQLTDPYMADPEEVPGAITFREDQNVAGNFNYEGLTFLGFASVRRFDEEPGVATPIPSSVENRVAWPAWAIEPRVLTRENGTNVEPLDNAGATTAVDTVREFPWNRYESEEATELNRRARDNDSGLFEDGTPATPFYRSFEDFLTDITTTTPAYADVINLHVAPQDSPGAAPRNAIRDDLHQLDIPWGTQRVEMPPRNREPELIRVGDLLATLAIGPSYSPFRERDGTVSPTPSDEFPVSGRERAELLRARWVTLPEAMAYALDYASQEWDPTNNGSKRWNQPFAAIGRKPFYDDNVTAGLANPLDVPIDETVDGLFDRDPATAGDRTTVPGALDAGYLVLDNFVPFIDGDPVASTGEFPSPFNAFDESSGDVSDIPLGLGIPAAIAIVERITPNGGLRGGIPAFDEPSTPLDESIVRVYRASDAIIGVLNANTASRNALRTVPMLTPTFDHDDVDAGAIWGEPRWVYNGTTNADEAVQDIASAITAYRDLRRTAPYLYDGRTPLLPSGLATPAGFDDAALLDFRIDDPFATLPFEEALGARGFATHIPGLRADGVDLQRSNDSGEIQASEAGGLRSPAELLAIRLRNQELIQQTASGSPDQLFATRNRTDRLGWDGENTAFTAGLDSTNDVDRLEDEVGERFGVYNAAAASLDVRSDYFAIWFLVHGYSEADVNVGPDGPLVPSVRKRYLLVLDRSNVRRAGDRPRVVLFEELPTSAN